MGDQIKIDIEQERSQTAIWQHDYRERKRGLGYTKIENYIPTEYIGSVKKLLSKIVPLPHTKRGNTILFLLKLIELCESGSAVVITKTISRGWQIRDFGRVPVESIHSHGEKINPVLSDNQPN